MMLELLMTRQSARDKAVIRSAVGLDFLVLDELHTYRGRQGADVAMLVRRVRDRLCREKPPICIGTSATMSSEEGDFRSRHGGGRGGDAFVRHVVGADAVIDESLQRATDPVLNLSNLGHALALAINSEIPEALTDKELRQHPLAVWIELRLGLNDGHRLERLPPITIADAASRLSEDTTSRKSAAGSKSRAC